MANGFQVEARVHDESPPIGAPGPRVSMACLYARRPSACDEGASQHVRRRSRMRPHCASRLVYCAP